MPQAKYEQLVIVPRAVVREMSGLLWSDAVERAEIRGYPIVDSNGYGEAEKAPDTAALHKIDSRLHGAIAGILRQNF